MYIMRALPHVISGTPVIQVHTKRTTAEAAAKLHLQDKYMIQAVQLWITNPIKSTYIKEMHNG